MSYPNEPGWRVVAAAMLAYARGVADEVAASLQEVDSRIEAVVGLRLTEGGWTWDGVVVNGRARAAGEIKAENAEAISDALSALAPHPSSFGAINRVIETMPADSFFRSADDSE